MAVALARTFEAEGLAPGGLELRPLTWRQEYGWEVLLATLAQECLSLKMDFPHERFEIALTAAQDELLYCWIQLLAEDALPARLYRLFPDWSALSDQDADLRVQLIESAPQHAQTARVAAPERPLLERVTQETGCIGDHPRFTDALDRAVQLADLEVPLLLQGPFGSGREALARCVYQLGPRTEGPFVFVNASLLPHAYAESVLFGHRKGSFPGAHHDRRGKCGLADRGILYIAEIDELARPLQERLAAFVETGMLKAQGAEDTECFDIRLIASTTRPWLSLKDQGNQLDPRLAALFADAIIAVPSYRDRASDVPKIALHILHKLNATQDVPKQLSKEALAFLEQQYWPRNFLDLQAVLERAFLYTAKPIIEAEDLSVTGGTMDISTAEAAVIPDFDEGFSLESFMSDMRRRIISKAIAQAGGNQSEAARLLKITPQAVHQFIKRQRS